MNRQVVAFVVTASFLLASCSDFLNKKNGVENTTPVSNPSKPGSALPPDLQKPNEGAFTEAKMLVNVGLNVQFPAVQQLNANARLMGTKIRRYCEALKINSNVDAVAGAAKDQFKETMLAFHFVDAANSGPLSDRGRWIVDNIYSWPYVDYCGVDRSVVALANTGRADTRVIHTSKGLAAIEYLLFETTLKSRCNLRAYPEVKDWNLKSAEQKQIDRCEEAAVLAADLTKMTTQLESDWDPKNGNYVSKLVDGSVYSSIKESTNALMDSMFIGIEKVKDTRLGKPLGRHKECLNDSKKCPELVEHAFSGLSLDAVEAQLKGFEAVWNGDFDSVSGFGFDEFVREQGHAGVAEQMRSHIQDSLRSVRTLKGSSSLAQQINEMDAAACSATTKTARQVEVCALHADVREIANLIKIEIFSILSLRAPSFGQGDND